MVARRAAWLTAWGALGLGPAARADEPLCTSAYADELTVLSPRVRELERSPANKYSYCLRTSATYECLSYGPDGSIRRSRKSAVAHGTAFAYRRSGGETFLVTNDHLASWPAVTDEEHRVDDVPPGCKMVSETYKIVEDEEDTYEANDVVLTRVVADTTLDTAILKTRTSLKLIPYRIGQSNALRVGNVVAVHGFPLGVFAATNLGKVVNAYDHDTAHDWDHVDFVTDALLSPGNSGSPVLAVSCKTGEYELVGVYHAGYVHGSALNVVVGIDQLRNLLINLKRTPRVSDAGDGLGPRERTSMRAALGTPNASPFFPFGPLVGAVRAGPSSDGALWFEVFGRSFPMHDERLLVVEDLPDTAQPTSFGELGRLYFGNRRGLRALSVTTLDGEARAQLDRILTRLHANAVSALRYRATDTTTHQGAKRQRAIERERERRAALDRDAAQALIDLGERFGPKPGDKVVPYLTAIAPMPPVPEPLANAPSTPEKP